MELETLNRLKRLFKLGYLGTEFVKNNVHVDFTKPIDEVLLQVVLQLGISGIKQVFKDFQKLNGLEETGLPDGSTLRALTAPRYCNLPDVLPLAAGTQKWPMKKLTWAVGPLNGLRGITPQQAVEGITWAFGQWQNTVDLTFTQIQDYGSADIRIAATHLDGSGQVLAESELADGTPRPKFQRYDTGESWDSTLTPPPNRISWPLVVIHELGHVLGLPHIPSGMGIAVMNPIYNIQLKTLQNLDIQWGTELYGMATLVPTKPVPTPVNPGTPGSITLAVSGNIVIPLNGTGITSGLKFQLNPGIIQPGVIAATPTSPGWSPLG
jgi:hypothetical protein